MRAVAYLFGLILIGGFLTLGQVMVPGVAVPLGFAIAALLLFLGRPWVPVGYSFTLGAGVLALWFGSSNRMAEHMAFIAQPFLPIMQRGTMLLFAGLAVVTVIGLFQADRKALRPVPALVLAMVLTFFVATLSGDAGGASPMREWFMHMFGLSRPRAELAVLLLRKTIHFTFYATVGFAGTAAARSGGESPNASRGIGLGYTLLLAVFDEVRQTGAATRTGSPVDVALDMAGALVGSAIALRVGPKRASPAAKQS